MTDTRESHRPVYYFIVLAVVIINYIFLTLQQRQQQQQQQQQQLGHEADAYRQRVARLLVFCLVLLSYQLGVAVAIRTNPMLGLVISLVALHIVYLITFRLGSARVVDEEAASQLVWLVERLNVATVIVSPRPMGMSPLQAVVHAMAWCLRVLGCSTDENRDHDELEDRMVP